MWCSDCKHYKGLYELEVGTDEVMSGSEDKEDLGKLR